MQDEQKSLQSNELYSALHKAQAMLNPAEKDSVAGMGSYKYKYANLSAVMGAAQEALSMNGLSFTTRIITENHITVFYARLAHLCGEYLESRIEIGINLHDIKAIQELGKAITYLRRYTFSMMVGVVTEEDDDAQSLVAEKKVVNKPLPPREVRPLPEYISQDQLDIVRFELENDQETAQKIIAHYGALEKMPRSEFNHALNRIRAIKDRKSQK